MQENYVDLGLVEGWALYDRPTPKALEAQARSYAKELFEAGQANRNARVTPEGAAEMLMEKFPSNENCWLSAKQVGEQSFLVQSLKQFFLSAPVFVQPSCCRCCQEQGGRG